MDQASNCEQLNKCIPLIQKIIGIKKDTYDIQDGSQSLYYIKWAELSYIHCSYLNKTQIMNITGGPSSMNEFETKINQSANSLMQSTSFPDLLVFNDSIILPDYFTVDRIIGKRIFHYDENQFKKLNKTTDLPEILFNAEKNDGKIQYYVKWCSLSYEESTWEFEENFPNIEPIRIYEERCQNCQNPVKIGDNKRNVDQNSFKKIDNPDNLFGYQIDGFNFLRFCWFSGQNSILGDDDELNKPVQMISVLYDIYVNHGIHGPFLLVTSHESLHLWKSEIERMTTMNVVVYEGSEKSREIIRNFEIKVSPTSPFVCFDILLTSSETFENDSEIFNPIEWRYFVLELKMDLHKKFFDLLMKLKFEHCTVLDGSLFSNSSENLWKILHLIDSERFNDEKKFISEYNDIQSLRNLRMMIAPLIIRRIKSHVFMNYPENNETIIEVDQTEIQKKLYRKKLIEHSNTLTEITKDSLLSLSELTTQLRKILNHPFLLKEIRDQIYEKVEKSNDKQFELKTIVESSGKMILIDKFLPQLISQNHKIIITSHMNAILDIISTYLSLIGTKFERIDGFVSEEERRKSIDNFEKNSEVKIFLFSASTGGIGVKFNTADTAIIFDSDWNRKNDIRAVNRCVLNRRKIKIYRFVSRSSFEIAMNNDKINSIFESENNIDANELEMILRFGVQELLNDNGTKFNYMDPIDINDSKEFWSRIIQMIQSKSEEKEPF